MTDQESKVNKALAAFWDNFDEDNITAANQEASSLLQAAQFKPTERVKFISSLTKDLSKRHISLDCLT